ncbi:hypothetical protein ACLVWU_09545 [Bdellovibrio sp. HCB290]|uniref:hypothetical protein n=1 Tax=Bdellovibrio sp. HCB290 TaxID=3394356 RepID=UPI0039B62175
MANVELYKETEFLHDIGANLNAALFIIDRLIEEIKGEEGRLETDSETEKLFHHLASYLNRIDRTVKDRRTHLSEILEAERRAERETFKNSRTPL